MLCGFESVRSCDRRLKVLIDEGYLTRRRYIYGVAGLLSITEKARRDFDIELPVSEPRLDQIIHDIAVTDTVIYMTNVYKIPLNIIVSEKELRTQDGFTARTHKADFIINHKKHTFCVEVELSTKSKDRLMNNVRQNYMTYSGQIWTVPQGKVKIRDILEEASEIYPNIKIIDMEVIDDFIRRTARK